MDTLLDNCAAAVDAAERYRNVAVAAVGNLVRGEDGRLDPARMESAQYAVHGLAWLATYVEAL